jgi:hypothetical protein
MRSATSAQCSRRAEACAVASRPRVTAANALADSFSCGRRAALLAASSAALLPAGSAVAGTDVGSYLPKAGVDDFVLFVPDKTKTPAIRAGTVDSSKPYQFALPPSWSERKVANIASGEILMTCTDSDIFCLHFQFSTNGK